MKVYLEKLMNREHLTVSEMKAATNACFSKETTISEIAAFLTALRVKGETPDEISGIVEVIREKSDFHTIKIDDAMDNCGTGGDQSLSFNISTTSAFVIAGAGVTVAKHGNRSISSQTGSADVLEELGVSLLLHKEQVDELLHENKIAFLFAPHVHKRLAHFQRVRKELKVPTIFNMIGPLTNPIQLKAQFLGVYQKNLLRPMAESLLRLGRSRALVVHGAGKMDEASLLGTNELILIEDGKLKPFTLHPEEVNLPIYTKEDIRGGNAKENAKILLNVLKGKKGPHLDTVLLNAGLALFANGIASSVVDGIERAKESIESGSALERLETLIQYSQKAKVR